MATRIRVALKGDAQFGEFDGNFTPEFYNEVYVNAVKSGEPTISFRDVDGDYFSFMTFEVKAISFVAV